MKISLPDFFFSVDLLALSLSNKTNSQMFFFFFYVFACSLDV